MSIIRRYEQMFRSLAPENLKAQLKSMKGTLGDGAINIILSSIIASLMILVVFAIQMAFMGTASILGGTSLESTAFAGLGIVLVLLIAVLIPVLAVVGSLIVTGVMWIIAKLLGGSGTFTQQFFQFSYPMGGIMIISSVIGIIPCLGDLVSLVLSLYSLYIAFEIYRSVHKLSDARAILIVALPIILVILLGLLIVVLFAGLIASLFAAGAGAYYS